MALASHFVFTPQFCLPATPRESYRFRESMQAKQVKTAKTTKPSKAKK